MREETSLIEKEMALGNEAGRRARRFRRRLLLIFISLAALLLVLFALTRLRNQPPANGNAAAPAVTATPASPIDVTTAAAITRKLQRSVAVVGSLAADEEVVVAAQVAGELSQLHIDFGSFVTRDQVIAVIDQRDANLKVEQAEATLKQTMARLGMKEGAVFDPQQSADVKVARAALDLAKIEFDRSTRLVENGDISRSEYDQKQISYNSAQARYQAALDAVNQQLALVEQQRSALALAKKTVTDTLVRAPISGAVKEKSVSRGTYLPVNGKIATLVKINPLRLRADIPAYAAASVRTGQIMNLNVESFPGRTFTGRVVCIGPSLNEQTRALTVEAEVANPGNQLRPGMFATAQLITAKDAPAVMIPQRAVVPVAGLTKVFVITNGKAVERIVKTGAIDSQLIEIIEGINEGETVALDNQEKLQTGVAVRM
ncbi:MAG: efflux RND transporter periplasmic adaptor subunit [Acidobacteria bacterium]|nr:efflux RND transporter periplasmic adaptor subunit [Acidobacteriota bacterium]